MRHLGALLRALADSTVQGLGVQAGGGLLPLGASLLVPVCAVTVLALPPSAVERLTGPVLGRSGAGARLTAPLEPIGAESARERTFAGEQPAPFVPAGRHALVLPPDEAGLSTPVPHSVAPDEAAPAGDSTAVPADEPAAPVQTLDLPADDGSPPVDEPPADGGTAPADTPPPDTPPAAEDGPQAPDDAQAPVEPPIPGEPQEPGEPPAESVIPSEEDGDEDIPAPPADDGPGDDGEDERVPPPADPAPQVPADVVAESPSQRGPDVPEGDSVTGDPDAPAPGDPPTEPPADAEVPPPADEQPEDGASPAPPDDTAPAGDDEDVPADDPAGDDTGGEPDPGPSGDEDEVVPPPPPPPAPDGGLCAETGAPTADCEGDGPTAEPGDDDEPGIRDPDRHGRWHRLWRWLNGHWYWYWHWLRDDDRSHRDDDRSDRGSDDSRPGQAHGGGRDG